MSLIRLNLYNVTSILPNKFEEKLTLLKLKALRDPDSFARVYDLYMARVYRFVYFKVSVKEDVEDITAEVFLKVWRYIQERNKIGNLNALLYSTARNLVIDYYRSKKRKQVSLSDISEKVASGVDSERIQSGVEVSMLLSLLGKLKDEYREVILLRCVEGYSVHQTATIMGKSAGSVKVLLYRAKKCLQNLYE